MTSTVAGLTKLILNNKIVEFRKPVRQSRVHCISKLSREIKKLKEKKGTDEQKAKNAKKAERHVQEIRIMKNLSDDEVSKFALLNESTLTDITNDVNESLEKKALARLVHHKAVDEKVRNFRETFPEWKACLQLLLETLGEKYKHKKPTKKAKTSKNTKMKVETSSGRWTMNRVERDPMPQQRSEPDERVPSSADECDERVPVTVKSSRSKRNVPVPSSTDDRDEFEENPRAVGDSENVTEEKPESVKGAVDPFFLTKDNVEYVSVSAKESNRPSDEGRDKDWPREFNSNNRRQRSHFDGRRKETPAHSSRWEPKKRIIRSEKPVQSEPVAALHPSWEAKRKLTQLVPFEGKKIKFDSS